MKIKLMNNPFLKLLSLGFAVLLWLVVMSINDVKISDSYMVEVELINTDVITGNGKVFRVEEDSDIVKVTVQARRSVLEKLKASDFILKADMKKNLRFDNLVEIEVECKSRDIDVKKDVTLSRNNVEVSIEDSASEYFPITVGSMGTENSGLVVGSLTPEQTSIKISGPASIVEKIKKVEAIVDITGLPGTAVRTCNLKLLDGDGDLIDTTYLNYVGKSDGIDVKISMLKTKTVPLKFSYVGTPAENYEVKEINWKPETVEIAASEEVLAGIHEIEIPAEAVNVEGKDEEFQQVVDLTQYLPSGIILKKADEPSVLVVVELQKIKLDEETEGAVSGETFSEKNN